MNEPPEQPMSRDGDAWHTLDGRAVARRLSVGADTGLAEAEVERRRREHGANVIPEGRRRTIAAMLLGQFADFMIIVLIAAALVSGIVGEPEDAIAIAIIILLNATVGVVQEFRAERALAALRAMAAPSATVRRDGRTRTVPAAELVPGDVVLLEAGNGVPADLRLLQAQQLGADESALTGESQAVEKDPASLDVADVPLGDRRSLAFKGSTITRGRGEGIVIATGMQTELGRIAELLRTTRPARTPLQARLARFGRRLAIAVLAICALIFGAGLLRGEPVVLMFLTAVSLAVAAIPEALPAVVTISLALGARKMIRTRALVRRLPAVETLGSVTYICADKTGTLTENRMRAEFVLVGDTRYEGIDAKLAERCPLLGPALAISNDVRIQADAQPVGVGRLGIGHALDLQEGGGDGGVDPHAATAFVIKREDLVERVAL